MLKYNSSHTSCPQDESGKARQESQSPFYSSRHSQSNPTFLSPHPVPSGNEETFVLPGHIMDPSELNRMAESGQWGNTSSQAPTFQAGTTRKAYPTSLHVSPSGQYP